MGEHTEYGHRLVGKSAVDNTDVIIAIGKDSKFICEEAKRLRILMKITYIILIQKKKL